MSNLLLTVNLTTRTASFGDDIWTPDALSWDEELPLGLRLTETVEGTEQPFTDEVVRIRALVGEEDARPESGKWALQVGDGAQTADNTTDLLQHDCPPGTLSAAIVAKVPITDAYGAPVVTHGDGSYMIIFGDGDEQVPLQLRANTLFPLSFGRISAYQVDGVWRHEIRLIRLPVATIKRGGDGEIAVARKLPPKPVVEEIFAGGPEAGTMRNELQSLYVPPQFSAAYVLNYAGVRTAELTAGAGASDVQSAIEGVLGTGNIKVTEQAGFTFFLEYIGDLKEAAQDEPEVEVLRPPLGDLVFTVKFNSNPLQTLLKRSALVTLPFEVRLETRDEDDVLTKRVAFRTTLTVQRPIGWEEIDVLEDTDWTKPPSPVDYVPRSDSTIFLGDKTAGYIRGNAIATVFAIGHPYETRDLQVWVVENSDGGRELINGTDYRANYTDENTVTVTSLTGAPILNGWAIYIRAALPVAAFAEGLTITTGQVTGLDDLLSGLRGDVTTLQNEVLTISGTSTDTGVTAADPAKIPGVTLVWPPAHTFPGPTSIVDVAATIVETTSGGSVTYQGSKAISSQRTLIDYAPLTPAGAWATGSAIAADATLPVSGGIAADGNVHLINAGVVVKIAPSAEGIDALRPLAGEYVVFKNGHWAVVRLVGTIWYPTACEGTLLEETAEWQRLTVGKTWEINAPLAITLASFTSEVIGRGRYVLESAVLHNGANAVTLDSLTWTERLSLTVLPCATTLALALRVLIDCTAAAPVAMVANAAIGGATASWQPHLIGTFTAALSTDKLTLASHGLLDGDLVYVAAAAGGTLPVGITAGTSYYVVSSASGDFKLALTAGGAAINLTADSIGTCKVYWATVSQVLRVRFVEFDPGPAPSGDPLALAGSLTVSCTGATSEIRATE